MEILGKYKHKYKVKKKSQQEMENMHSPTIMNTFASVDKCPPTRKPQTQITL